MEGIVLGHGIFCYENFGGMKKAFLEFVGAWNLKDPEAKEIFKILEILKKKKYALTEKITHPVSTVCNTSEDVQNESGMSSVQARMSSTNQVHH